ncbi:MAG TPA: histidine phosphatase family protein [Acidimicrobiia bacterium]|nr:histidine phosphatase family protein [Acidimicrobiia bacterium]
MAALVHLVRHAQIENPEGVVYGTRPGFGLSAYGVEQARRVGRYLGPRPLVAIWSSPLERALRTAEEIAARVGVPVRVHPDLREWDVTERWAGHRWAELTELFPGEFEAYRDHPQDLPFANETLTELAERFARFTRQVDADHPHGDVVLVSHQDPIQAGRLRLLGSPLASLNEDKPSTGAVITLRPGTSWKEETHWSPEDTPRFGEKSGLRSVETSGSPTSA